MTLITTINREIYTLTPIIFELKEKIKKHILVYDSDDKNIAKRVKTAIKELNLRYKLSQTITLIEVDEDSKSDMLQIQNRLKEESGTLYLNATNADMALVVVLSGFVLHHNGKVIAYDAKENSYNLITKNGFTNHHINKSMKIEDFLTLSGYKLQEEIDKNEIYAFRKSILYIFHNFKEFFIVRNLLYKNLSLFVKKYPIYANHLYNLGIMENGEVIKPISYFGTLFEQFIFLQLAHYDFDDIKVGASINFHSIVDQETKLQVMNEFDILAIKNNHIYTVECKLGDNIHAQEIIYKSDSLLDYFGDYSKNLIMNIHQERQKGSKVFKRLALLRAHSNNIDVYNEFDFEKERLHKQVENLFQVKKRMFLLGGYDLEMKTIKKLLKKRGENYRDKNLTWGASLSAYKEELKNNYHFYAIELIEDIQTEKPLTLIDHHNELQYKKSSLEQICELLAIKMERKLKLIAINDAQHIKGMLAFGATKEEIEEIRKKDRKAQGVTEEDELLALSSIEEKQVEEDILIIYAKTDKFSTIADRLYGKNALIYNESKLNYYGRDIKILVKKYKKEIEKRLFYYGGDFGFFGVSEKSFTPDEINNLKNKILSLLKK